MHVLIPVKKIAAPLAEIAVAAQPADSIAINIQHTKTERVTYPFVDLIRFLSTLGIVFIHAEFFLTNNEVAFFHKVNHIEYYFAMRQVFKFATICYFLIAGFLLAGKIEKNERFNYFMRRLRVIAKPYLFAILLFAVGFILHSYAGQKITLAFMFETFKYIVCYTSFWYVPNYLICLSIIIIFSKYTRSVYFGAALFLMTLWYTYFTVYSTLHTSSHTTALLGFVFYMWLGMYIKRNDLVSKIQQINLGLLIGTVILIFIISNYETWYLFHFTHTQDSLNTLRVSNQLYSVAIFALLIRVCNRTPNFGIFRPKQETYGIYLYHCFFIFFIIPASEQWVCNHFHVTLFSYNVFHLIIINLINFVICYFATTFTVKTLIRFKLAFLPYE
jgi:hypothetical protein